MRFTLVLDVDAGRPTFYPTFLRVFKSAYEMKRHLKPFAVEIKKSRVPGQRQQLPPRRLVGIGPAEAEKNLQSEAPVAAAEPAQARRILPSLREPVRAGSERDESVDRKRSTGSKVRRRGTDLD